MGNTRHEVANDGIGIFDLRFSPNFRRRLAGYDKREVELYIRRQEAAMTKIRLEKEQLERQLIRLRQQLATIREQLSEARSEADAAKADAAIARAEVQKVTETAHEPDANLQADPDQTDVPAKSADATTDADDRAVSNTTAEPVADGETPTDEPAAEPEADADPAADDDNAGSSADAESVTSSTDEVTARA
jgi:hypothetical protein